MKRAQLFLQLLVTTFFVGISPLFAQNPTPGQNVNMVSGMKWPGGDPFLQRQNEPSIAVSTRNPQHLLAGANDYRTVDLNLVDQLPINSLAGDAWMGVFKSFDGGQRWQSTLLPGFPQDQSAFGAASPMKGFQAASDPVVRAGTNGMFYYSSIALNRNNNLGGIFISTFIDLNNKENGDAAQSNYPAPTTDPIRYINTVEVDSGTAGQFIDKPWMAVDIPRSGAGTCSISAPVDNNGTVTQSFPAGNVYLAYAMFVGGQINVRSKINFAKSSNCGATWSKPIIISQTYNINQGASIAVDPETGAVYVAWRVFTSGNDQDEIVVAKSTDGGNTFSKATPVRALYPYNSSTPNLASFLDAGTSGTEFRTQSMPTIAVDDSLYAGIPGRVYVAWSERDPGSSGDARVMLSTSSDGVTWSSPMHVDSGSVADDFGNAFARGHQLMPAMTFIQGKLTLIYYDVRLDHTVGLFEFTTPSIPDPNTGKFFLEDRPYLGDPASSVFTPFIDDSGLTQRRHTIDVMLAQSNGGASPTFNYARVSRYDFGLPAPDESNSQQFEQLKFNPPNLPMFAQGTVPFIGDYIDVAGQMFVPAAGGGWTFNNPAPAGSTSGKPPTSSPAQYATWTTNQDVVPPANGDWTKYYAVTLPGQTSSIFQNGTTLPGCQQGFEGDRNQNIYSSRITQGLLVTSPQNSKPLVDKNGKPIQRAFAVLVQNSTDKQRYFQLSIANQPPGSFNISGQTTTGGYASFVQALPNQPALPNPLPKPVIISNVAMAPHSGVARSVFVLSNVSAASVSVNVVETDQSGTPLNPPGLSSFIVFNADPSAVAALALPDSSTTDPNLTEIYDPNIITPNIITPNIITSDQLPNIITPNIITPNIITPNIITPNIITSTVKNSRVANPNIITPNIITPNIITNALTDAVYTVNNGGNTNASYRVKLTGATSTPLQLTVAQIYTTPTSYQCQLIPQVQNVNLSNVATPQFTPVNQLGSPNIITADPGEASISLAPGDSAVITLRAPVDKMTMMQDIVTQVAPVIVPDAIDTNSTATAPNVLAPLFITTASLPDEVAPAIDPTLNAIGGDLSAACVGSWSLTNPPAGISLSAPSFLAAAGGSPGMSAVNLVGTPTVGTFNFSAQVQDCATPTPNVVSRQLTLNVYPQMFLSASGLPTGFVGSAYGPQPLVSGGTGTYNAVVSGTLPPGLTISNGNLTGTPTTAGGDSFSVTFNDTAHPPQTASQTFNITISSLAITTSSLPAGIVGQTYNLGFDAPQLQASGGTPPYTFSIPAGLPPGLSLNQIAQVVGTATAAGMYSFAVHVTDSSSPAVTASKTLSISIVNPLAIITASPLPSGFVGNGYSQQLTATGGTGNYTWTVSGGALPTGIALSPGGLLSGTPTQAGTFTLDANVQDNGPPIQAVANALTLSIHQPVEFTAQPTNGFINVDLNPFTVMVRDASGAAVSGVSVTISIASGPAGAVLSGPSLTQTTDATGQTTFSYAMLNLPGTYTLLATAGASSGVSNTFSLSGFVATGNLNTARAFHTATLLPNGKVLVAGGIDANGNSLNSGELYDPTTGIFTAITGSSMSAPRAGHTATLLTIGANAGKVLIAGGQSNVNGQYFTVSGSDLYDPSSNTFTAGPAPNCFRAFRTATTLADGTILFAGGQTNSGGILSDGCAEIFNGTSFTLASHSMLSARAAHSATLLSNGQVLITGGRSTNAGSFQSQSDTELYDPTNQTFSAGTPLSETRFNHTATLLNNGKVLLVGGIFNPTASTYDAWANFEFYNVPGLGIVDIKRESHTATLLQNGKVLVIGGRNPSLSSSLTNTKLFDSASGQFPSDADMGIPRDAHTATLLPNGTVLVTGGESGGTVPPGVAPPAGTVTNSAQIYVPVP